MPIFLPAELAAWTGGAWTRPPPAAARVCHDSREVRPGDLYVAIRGERHDGHDFVADAFAKGAVGAVVDAAFAAARPDAGALLAVGDPLAALRAIARGHRARLRGEILAVTGSVGKSTVKEMTAAVLAAAGATARSVGNWNNEIGVPLSLLRMEPGDAFGVFEVGMNHPGELAPLCALLRPAWGLMTRIAPVHTEFFAGEAQIAREKAELFRALPPGGTAVAARDEPWFEALAEAAAHVRLLTVAMRGPADFAGAVDAADPAVLAVTEPDGAVFRYRMPLPGEPVRRNALRAIAAGRAHGLAPEAIARALADFRPLPMRWNETVDGGVRWINDAYNASPASMRAAIETLADLPVAGGKWLVLGGMRELDAQRREAHRDIGRAAAAGRWAGLVVKGALAVDIAEGAVAAGWPPDRVWRCADAPAAAAALRARLRPGDAVLLKGSRTERMEDVWTEWLRLEGLEVPEAAH